MAIDTPSKFTSVGSEAALTIGSKPVVGDELAAQVGLEHSGIVRAILPRSPELILRRDILAAWTGIDHSVYDALDEVDVLWNTLVKELAILAELGKEGAGQQLLFLINEAISSGLSYEDIAADFNALVEYGDCFANLTPPQRLEAAKHEIQDEFGHFWRIMGIDSIFRAKIKKIVGELPDVIAVAGTLERELGVIRERRISRESAKPYLPVKKNAEPEGTVRVQSPHMVSIARRTYPYVSAVISNASGFETVDHSGRVAFGLFSKLLTKYPIEEAVALLDFLLYKSDFPKDKLQFLALQEYAQEGRQWAKIVSIGTQMVIHTRPAENFSHSLVGVHRGTEGSIGQRIPATYSRMEFEVQQGDVFQILSVEYSEVLEGMTVEELTSLLNQRGVSGWILASNNIRRHIGGRDNGIMTQKCLEREEFVPPQFTDALISSQLATLVDGMVKTKPLYVAVEGAHVHADRSVSNTQAVGARIAGLLSEMLGTHNAEIFGAPMVDDDHVVNAFDYKHFSDLLQNHGYHFMEIIFESSPLVYEVSLDILRYLAAEHPELLKQIGDNLYLEVGDIMIELVEGLSDEFKTGCVLFDAALCLYKLCPELLTEMYKRHVASVKPDSPFALESAHSVMLRIYQSTKNPEDRETEVKKDLPDRTVRFSDIFSGKNKRPFLDAVSERVKVDSAEKDQYVVTILEGTYSNQQKKLEALMGLLNLIDSRKIITVMFDQESGKLTFTR